HGRNQNWIDETTVWSSCKCLVSFQNFSVNVLIHFYAIGFHQMLYSFKISFGFYALGFSQQLSKQFMQFIVIVDIVVGFAITGYLFNHIISFSFFIYP